MVKEKTPLIALHNIRKHYGGEQGAPIVEVLRGIDLEIFPGEFVAIVGASGSGKSTLMHILGCLDRPSSGRYTFNGQDVAHLDGDSLAWLRREAFGFVFQGYHLIATESARENVEVPALYAGMPEAERAERASALLTRLGLGEKQNNRPNQLSGGQQQRVSIARALMNGGRIILADEPTGALDRKSGAEVMVLLRELAAAGHTIILITHDRQVAEQAQRVIEISDGEILSDSAGKVNNFSAAMTQPDLNAHREQPTVSGSVRDALRAAWRMMWLNRFRTALTLLGIVIGVASVIVMLAIGEGTKQKVVAQMGTLGTNIMYMGPSRPADGGPRGVISEDDLEAIANLPQIKRVLPVIGDPLVVRYGNIDREVYTFASAFTMPQIHHWRVAEGRFYTNREDQERTPVAVLGHQSRQQFFPDENPLGKQMLIGGAPFEVIGVMEERGADSGAQSYDEMIFIPYLAGRVRVYQAMTQPDYTVVEAVSSDVVKQAETAILDLMRERHGRRDVGVSNAAAQLQAEAETRNTMTLMLSLIAAVSLLVGGIGVMNVMLMTVRERNREIGIRMATGARQSDILRQFLTEAVLVTVVGGSAGVVLGLLIGAALVMASVAVIFSFTAIIAAFGCAVLTGLIFGYMPARSAARLDPVIALAGE